MSTQWRCGPGGAYGLDYCALPEIWRRTKTQHKDRDEVFAALQIMERAALEEMRAQE